MAQLVRAPPCHGGGRGFEPHPGRLIEKYVERVSHDFLSEHCYGLSHSGVNRSMPNQRFVIPRSQPNVSAMLYHTRGILAQLGEHLPYKQRVIGSSPIGPIHQ